MSVLGSFTLVVAPMGVKFGTEDGCCQQTWLHKVTIHCMQTYPTL